MRQRDVNRIVLVSALALFGWTCGTVQTATLPGRTELRLPGLPWGISSPEVTAALVERGFRYTGRNATGDLRFSNGELLGFDASLVARMHRDRLVKIVAFLEPRTARVERDIESIVERLRRFYGSPSSRTEGRVWIRHTPDGRPYGAVLRTTKRPAYRLDLESPIWPAIHAARRKAEDHYAAAGPSET